MEEFEIGDLVTPLERQGGRVEASRQLESAVLAATWSHIPYSPTIRDYLLTNLTAL